MRTALPKLDAYSAGVDDFPMRLISSSVLFRSIPPVACDVFDAMYSMRLSAFDCSLKSGIAF